MGLTNLFWSDQRSQRQEPENAHWYKFFVRVLNAKLSIHKFTVDRWFRQKSFRSSIKLYLFSEFVDKKINLNQKSKTCSM